MIIKDKIKLNSLIVVIFIVVTRENVSGSFLYPSIIYKRNEQTIVAHYSKLQWRRYAVIDY
jgi:hypothetical protein